MRDWDDRPARQYIRVERVYGVLQGRCGECGALTGWKSVDHCFECGVHFTQITSPYEHERAFCERVRPDLTYVVFQWA